MKKLTWVALLILMLPVILFAQDNANTQKGFLPYGSYQEGGIDSVSLSSGALILHALFYSLPQRGSLTMNLFLGYNSKGYHLQYECDNTGIDCLWYWRGGSSGVQIGWDQAYEETTVPVFGFQNSQLTPLYERANVTTPDGGTHHLMYTGNPGNSALRSFDGTGIRSSAVGQDAPNNGIIDRSGNYHMANSFLSPLPVVLAQDSNGNQILWQNGLPPAQPLVSDTLGRTMTWPIYPIGSLEYSSYRLGTATADFSGCTGPLPISSATLWSLPGAVSGTFQVKLCYAMVSILTNFPAGDVQVQGTGEGLQSIVLPNNTAWSFEYNSRSPGDPPNVNYADLSKITLPTGATISYSWNNLQLCDPFSQGNISRAITSRTIDAHDGTGPHTFTYNYSNFTSGSTPTTTVTDPQGNQGVHVFTMLGGSDCSYYEIRRQDFVGSSTGGVVLKTTATDYRVTQIDVTANPNSPSVAIAVQPLRTTTVLPNGQTSKVEEDYNNDFSLWGTQPLQFASVGTVSARREYDFGSSTPARTTTYSYLYQSNSAYFNRNILDRVTLQTVFGSDGSTQAQTFNSYDSNGVLNDLGGAPNHDGNYSTAFSARGNLTQMQRWLNTTNTFIPTITNTYDDLGNLRQTTDANGNSTTFDYSDNFPDFSCLIPNSAPQAWVTQTTNPLGQNTQTQYFGCTGLPVSHRDQNDINANRVNSSFTYDAMNRVTQIDYADGGQKTYFYNDDLTAFPMIYVREDIKLDSSNNISRTWTGLDGMGRKVRSAKDNGEGTANMFDMSDTCYDALGRVSTQNYPFQGAGWLPNPINCAASGDSFTYDALGRTTRVTHSDGSHVDTDYSQLPIVTVTDEAGKPRRNKTDALGRLLTVWEPDASGNFSYETAYQYDTLDNLIRVDQKGGDSNPANWRTRTFVYDSLSRLITATNPESGTITYAYDNVGNLISKTAPAPNQSGGATVTTSYTYDALNRLTTRTFSDNSHSATYIYDRTPLWGVNVQNPIGRLVGTYGVLGNLTTLDGSSGGGGVGSVFSYDVMGRVIQDIQFNQHVLPWAPLQTFNYTYNLDGLLKTLQYPSGRTITYSYNTGQRPVSAADVGNGINYYTAAHYTAFGASASMVYGATPTFTGITWNNTFNSRMQPVFLTATTPSSTVFSLGYDFHLNSDDNGNVYAVNNNKITDHGRDQSFTYDQLNRLLTAQSAATSGPNCWGESFGYDPWANMTNRNVTKCSAEGSVPSVNTKNQMNGSAYDAAGNLLTGGYAYNSENQLIASPGVAYDYNVDGERMQKSDGTLYWHGLNGQVLEETNLSGTLKEEYIFFGGQRIARRDPSGAVHYYFADHLGSTDIVTNASGIVEEEREFYPFGGERVILDSGIGNNYKFNGKERDPETGLDEFGARYYSSALGRFTIPDWADAPTAVPYANFGNPQSLNLYSYVKNNPTTFGDSDGHCGAITCPLIWLAEGAGASVSVPVAVVLGGSAAILGSVTSPHYPSGAVGGNLGTIGMVNEQLEAYKTQPIQATNTSSQGGQQQGSDTQPDSKRPGTLGKPDHKATVEEERQRVNGKKEVKIETPEGDKDSRRADAVGTHPETGAPEVVQVYRPTPAGNIPKREVNAANDIHNATGVKPTMVPVRPLPKKTAD